MSRVLVLSEYWYPQGGGAELATSLYVKEMLGAGLRVTVLTNKDACQGAKQNNFSMEKFPFGAERVSKLWLTLRSSSIRKRAIELAKGHDIAYITGKLLFLAPGLRRANPDLRIIVHLHDYQLVCPHASLYNFLCHGRCSFVWSGWDCLRCAYRYESVENGGVSRPFLGALSTAAWRRGVRLPDLIGCVDSFITVSRAQAGLVASALGECADAFLGRSVTLYNPVETSVSYVPPSFGRDVCFGFFGGDRYMKGFDLARSSVEGLDGLPVRLLVAGPKTSSCPMGGGRVEHLGILSAAEVAELYRRVWMVLFMSRVDEPLPYVPVEAQLMGRPFLASGVGGVAELLVKEGYTGKLVGGDPVGFRDAVEELLVLLADRSSSYTREISEMSEEFFKERSMESYERFLRLMC